MRTLIFADLKKKFTLFKIIFLCKITLQRTLVRNNFTKISQLKIHRQIITRKSHYPTFPIYSCTSQDLLKYGIFICVIPVEIRKENPEFSFSVLHMQFFDIESVFAASL